MKKGSNKFAWDLDDIKITKPAPQKEEDCRCSRCGIPIFMAMKFYVVKGKDVCEVCLTKTEERNILRERSKKLGLVEPKPKGK